ncbi:MAG: YdgA family protein [Candidatus Competibacteraceae bacterium]
MNKLAGGAVVVVVLAAAGVTGAAYWSGMQAERWYEEALAEGAKNPNVKFSTVSYQRGLFSSQSVTRIQLAMPEGSDVQEANPSFSIRQDIYHGPLPLAGWGVPGIPMQVAGAVVRAVLEPDSSAWTRDLAKAYGNQPPVVAISRIAFDGASDTRIAMPPLTLDNTGEVQSLKFSGLQGQFQVAPKAAAVQGTLTVVSLEAVGKPTPASDAQPATNGAQVSLRDLSLTVNQRKGAFDLLFGESNFKISDLIVKDQASGAPFAINNLSISGSLTPQGAQQVAAEALIKASKVTVDQQSGEGSLKLSLRNLDGATVAKLQQWQQKSAGNPSDPQAIDELMRLTKTLLAGKPEFLIDSQAKLAQGDWQGQLTLNFQDFGDANPLLDPSGLLNALEKGAADVAASRTLVEALLTNTAREAVRAQAKAEDKTVDDQTVQTLAAQQVTEQLQGLTAAGFFTLEGDQYKSSARFAEGKLTLNGQEIPLTPAEGMDSGMTEEETLPEQDIPLQEIPLTPAESMDGGTTEEKTPTEPDAAAKPVQPQ